MDSKKKTSKFHHPPRKKNSYHKVTLDQREYQKIAIQNKKEWRKTNVNL